MASSEELEVKAKTSPKLSRRALIAGTALTAVFAAAKPLERVLDWLSESGFTSEGNLLQRKMVFEQLCTNLSRNPSEDNKQLLVSWLKFNAAQLYAQSVGWKMTSKAMTHFLYGKGEIADLSEELNEGFKQNGTNYFESVLISDIENLSGIDIEKWPAHMKKLLEEFREFKQKKSESMDIEFQVRNTALYLFEDGDEVHLDDVLFSFCRADAKGKGRLILPNEGKDDYRKTVLELSDFLLEDRYDWHGPKLDRYQLRSVLFPVLRRFGVKDPEQYLEGLLGKETSNRLLDVPFVDFDHAEGELLVRNGVATVFNMRASFNVSKTLKINWPEQFFR